MCVCVCVVYVCARTHVLCLLFQHLWWYVFQQSMFWCMTVYDCQWERV